MVVMMMKERMKRMLATMGGEVFDAEVPDQRPRRPKGT